MQNNISHESPSYAVSQDSLVPVGDYLEKLTPIPPSRMFLINKSLVVYKDKNPGSPVFDASQGDGGASLTGTPVEILEEAARMQVDNGTAYDMPFGTKSFRQSVIEHYWQLDPELGIGPGNVIGTAGGRDALVKAYRAMLALGHGRQGDVLVVSRVPWISYNWGPYGVGANVLWAPGHPDEGWVYSEEAIQACADYVGQTGRRIAGLVITCPDNPTGLTITPEKQAQLAKAALKAGIAFVLFDWMYHFVTDESPMDLNSFFRYFDPQERERIMFLDGLTKSLGASNIRNCHLIAPEKVAKYIISYASHSVMPSYFSLAVAEAAYKMGYQEASRTIVEPTNASRKVLQEFLDEQGMKYIIGKGYYAFIHVGKWLESCEWSDSEPLGQYLAEEHGVAIVPGAFFSPFGSQWIRFSYATPPERTLGAARRLLSGLNAMGNA
jgi:aspartate/methionine/tyrosine aminotransferase